MGKMGETAASPGRANLLIGESRPPEGGTTNLRAPTRSENTPVPTGWMAFLPHFLNNRPGGMDNLCQTPGPVADLPFAALRILPAPLN